MDLLRLLAALLVLYSHQYELLGQAQPSLFNWNTLGGLGVSVFFFLSGCLVSTSWLRDPHIGRFFMRRSLRIFPGLCVAVLWTVLFLGPLVSNLKPSQYFSDPAVWSYLSNAFLLTRYTLPGVFMDNPCPEIVNGSLWTLRLEFICYLGIGLLGAIPRVSLFALSIVVLLTTVILDHAASHELRTRYGIHLEMFTLFWWGVLFGYVLKYSRHHMRPPRMGLAAAALIFLLYLHLGDRGLERTAMLFTSALLVWVAAHVPEGARLTNPLGDFSYGVYIFAFPVQQWVVSFGMKHNWGFLTDLFLSLCITLIFASLSWHFVERRALRFKPLRKEYP